MNYVNLSAFPGIDIFGFTVTYYALCILAGIITATVLAALLMKRRNMSPDLILLLFVVCLPTAFVCARLYYCITDGMPASQWFSWTSLRSGGLSIIGGVIGGVAAGLVVCLIKKINFLRAADCVVITILIAQAIGRWGNYFNGEVYGAEITDPSKQWFPLAVEVGGKWYQALFFYEGCINTVGFILLYAAAWFFAKKPNGIFTFAYFLWYGVVRTVMEPMRNPQYILGSGTDVMWSQLTAILMIVFGAVGIIVLLLLNYRKEGALIGSKKGDPCGITAYLTPNRNETPYFSKINMLGKNYPVKQKTAKGGKADKSEKTDEKSDDKSDGA